MTAQSKFAVLGVPETFDLSIPELEKRFRERSLELHPDRAPRAERTRALVAATALNDAYRALRSPVARAEHLLELHDRPITDTDRMPQEFLVEIMELRERLADGDSSVVADVRTRREAALARLGAFFAAGRLDEAKIDLIAVRYFDRLIDADEQEQG